MLTNTKLNILMAGTERLATPLPMSHMNAMAYSTMAMLLMGHAHKPKNGSKPNLFMRLYHRFDAGFERMRATYIVILSTLLVRRRRFASLFLGFCVLSVGLVFVLGEDFFPTVDAGDIRLHMRAPTGTRIEETARRPRRSVEELHEPLAVDRIIGGKPNILVLKG